MKSMRYVVIGIGKYGSRIALEMAGRGAEVFAIDCVEERVENVADDVALAITMDSTDPKALRSQKLEELDAAVVAIGENFEATVLTTLNLMDLGIPRVIVRASGRDQERILRKLGVQEILAPETEFASLVAERLMNPNLRGFLELPDDFEIAEIQAPTGCVGRTLGEIDLTNRYELRLITIRRTYSEEGEDREHLIGIPRPDTEVQQTDTLVVFGTLGNVNRLLEVNE
ncbi:MAG: TrkA family potassium uptake protein [Flavobacteriales bacterium]|nr:TrkA family potassium uptake protein [Flavobacteriales bacterium]